MSIKNNKINNDKLKKSRGTQKREVERCALYKIKIKLYDLVLRTEKKSSLQKWRTCLLWAKMYSLEKLEKKSDLSP